jgi:hypothetical protein
LNVRRTRDVVAFDFQPGFALIIGGPGVDNDEGRGDQPRPLVCKFRPAAEIAIVGG